MAGASDDCVSAPDRDPTSNVGEGTGIACKAGGVKGPRSAPIGTPPSTPFHSNIKVVTPTQRGPGWAPIYTGRLSGSRSAPIRTHHEGISSFYIKALGHLRWGPRFDAYSQVVSCIRNFDRLGSSGGMLLDSCGFRPADLSRSRFDNARTRIGAASRASDVCRAHIAVGRRQLNTCFRSPYLGNVG